MRLPVIKEKNAEMIFQPESLRQDICRAALRLF
jgi:hypothetical protein